MTKTIRFRGFNPKKAKELSGYSPTVTDRIIQMRSNETHIEIQFVDRNGISFSSTMTDGADGCRLMHIGYSHSEQWTTIEIKVSDWQEQLMYEHACRMANVPLDLANCYVEHVAGKGFYQGGSHVRYDKYGLASFCLEKSGKWYLDLLRGIVWGWTNCIKPSKSMAWCSEAVCLVWNSGVIDTSQKIWPAEIDPQAAIEALIKIGGKQI